jgi:hypothetical protein
MIFKMRIGHWRITFTIAPVTDVIGVNSLMPDGNHILMWDFDDVYLYDITAVLRMIQHKYHLPNIYILTTGKKRHYIAYCFKRLPWQRVVEIIAATPLVDPNFFKYGVYRDHFTLRVTPKEGRKPKLAEILWSTVPRDCSIDELNSWTKYETLADNAPMKKWELRALGKP